MSLNNISLVWGTFNRIKQLTSAASAIPTAPKSKGPWRPTQWQGLPTDVKQLILIKTNIGGFFFDAVLREDHTETVKITEHPVQTGANISDHAYNLPAKLTMEIGMSDAMDSMVAGQFTGWYTKSVSAYQMLKQLKEARLPLKVLTRLNFYENMVIEEINTNDDFKTLNGLRCTVTMKEIFVVEVSKTTVSARPQTTGQTNRNTQQPTVLLPTAARALEDVATGTN
jgi:hypothetical protein